MFGFDPRRSLALSVLLSAGLWAAAAQAQEYRYHYMSLDQVPLPAGVTFFDPVAINNSGSVYGNAYTASDTHVAVYAHGG